MKLDASDIQGLEPVIAIVVGQVLGRIEAERAKLDKKLAYSEAEAATLLGVKRYVLRDARLRGEIAARRIGREYRYSRDSLLKFVNGE